MAIFWNDGTSLYHYGIPGMKWGVRRWQNPDGTFTPEGKERYFGVKSNNPNKKKQAYSLGKIALQKYKALDKKYTSLIEAELNKTNPDFEKLAKLDDEYSSRVSSEVSKSLYDAGYDFVAVGGGSDNYLSLQFGKYGKDGEGYITAIEDWMINTDYDELIDLLEE